MEEYRFERLQPKHYQDLIYISKSAFDIDPGASYYQLKNATQKFGEAHLGYIAYHISSNEPAAFYGVYSYPVFYSGKNYKAVQSGDTMTHKSHTGKGLFITLAKMTYKLAEDNGARFVFGFPNANSYPGFVRKLNWQHNGNLNLYKIKVKTVPLLKLVKKVRWLNGLFGAWFNFICMFYKPSKIFFENSIGMEGATIKHDESFFEYKKFSGCKLIKVHGFHLWVKPDGFLYIGDMERTAFNDFEGLIHGIKLFSFLAGVDVIAINNSSGTIADVYFQKYFVPEEGAAIGYLNFNCDFDLSQLKFTNADLDTF